MLCRDNGCKFFDWVEKEEPKATRVVPKKLDFTPKKRPPMPGYATYLSDWKKAEVLQRMVAVDPKLMSARTGARYDSVEVVGTWKINNPVQQEKFDAAKSKIKRDSPKDSDYNLPETYSEPMFELANTALDGEAGEVFLLHGTRPENLHSILFEGHNTALANNGLFGRGVYFAENAAKIDQYATNDEKYQYKGDVAELHERIYKECKCKHPQNVRYALVCRVLLGSYVTTSDGCKRIGDGKDIFIDGERNKLAALPDEKNPSSLIGIPGKLVKNFREFMVYDSDQVLVEYLVAYKRARHLCDCGKKYAERTVVKQTENRGRKFHFCANNSCNFMQMMPLCKCGGSATVKTSHSAKNPGRSFYCCCNRFKKSCDFFEWKDAASAPVSNPYKRARNA